MRTSEETTEVGYFALADTTEMDLGDFDRQRVADAFAARTATLIRDTLTQ